MCDMNDLCKSGDIKMPGDERIAHYNVKSYDEGSEFGINGGRISKLWIKIDNKVVVNYDRGWDVKPDESDELVMYAYNMLISDYN